jgi:hypothetical protein
MSHVELTVSAARALAAQYQSPGPVGRTFAAFASGLSVSYEDFMAECDMTSQEVGFEAHDDMAALRTFAGNTDAPIWKD